jgi:hypothetical protein
LGTRLRQDNGKEQKPLVKKFSKYSDEPSWWTRQDLHFESERIWVELRRVNLALQ